MKKFLIASLTLSLLRNITLGQDAPPTSATASASPAGTEETERVVVQSQEMDITRESIVPSLGATRYTVASDPTVSTRKRKAKTPRLTKRCYASPVSRRIRSVSFMSAANMQIYNTASTTCFSRKVFRVLARYWRPASRTTFRSLLARCRHSLDFAIRA